MFAILALVSELAILKDDNLRGQRTLTGAFDGVSTPSSDLEGA